MKETIGATSPYHGDYDGALQAADEGWKDIAKLQDGYAAGAEMTMPEGSAVAMKDPESLKMVRVEGGLEELEEPEEPAGKETHVGDQAESLRQLMANIAGRHIVKAAESADDEPRPQQSDRDLEEQDRDDEPDYGDDAQTETEQGSEPDQNASIEEQEQAYEDQKKANEEEKTEDISDDDFEDVAQRMNDESLAEWQESLKGGLDEYWQRMGDEQFAEHGVVLGEMPKLGDLRDEVMRSLETWSPGISPEALKERVDMATKMALQEYADRKGKALAGAKVKRRGFLRGEYQRQLPKGFEEDLARVVQKDARTAFRDIYGDAAMDLTDDAKQEELTNDELVAWKIASEEIEKPRAQKVLMAQWGQHPRRVGEKGAFYIQRLRNYAEGGEASERQQKADQKYEEARKVAAKEREVEQKFQINQSDRFKQIDALAPGDDSTPEGHLENLRFWRDGFSKRVENGGGAMSPEQLERMRLLLEEMDIEIMMATVQNAVEKGKAKEAKAELEVRRDNLALAQAYSGGLVKDNLPLEEQILQLEQRELEAKQGVVDAEEARAAGQAEKDPAKIDSAKIERDNYLEQLRMITPAIKALQRKLAEEEA